MKTFEEALYHRYNPRLESANRLCEQNDLFLLDQQRVHYDQKTHSARLHEFAWHGYTDH